MGTGLNIVNLVPEGYDMSGCELMREHVVCLAFVVSTLESFGRDRVFGLFNYRSVFYWAVVVREQGRGGCGSKTTTGGRW